MLTYFFLKSYLEVLVTGPFPMRGWMEAYLWNPVMDTPQKLNLNIAPESHDAKGR